MRLSDLSCEEKNLWIASKLEPKPTTKGQVFQSPFWGTSASEKGCWVWHAKFDTTELKEIFHHGQSLGMVPALEDHGEWQPRDMVNDPAMTLMLMEKILYERDYKQVLLDAETCFNTQLCEPPKECEQDHTACVFRHLHIHIHNRQLGLAIVDAFMLANGWEGDS